jgi:hypothetical protein
MLFKTLMPNIQPERSRKLNINITYIETHIAIWKECRKPGEFNSGFDINSEESIGIEKYTLFKIIQNFAVNVYYIDTYCVIVVYK